MSTEKILIDSLNRAKAAVIESGWFTLSRYASPRLSFDEFGAKVSMQVGVPGKRRHVEISGSSATIEGAVTDFVESLPMWRSVYEQ